MEKILKENGLDVSDTQLKQFQTYYELLMEWNQKINLTAITEREEVIRKHFVDSALLSKCPFFDSQSETKILDVGTGAGFPGIVLAILFPQCFFTLLDSLRKRIDFLQLVVERLELKNVHLFHGRAENYGRDTNFRNQYDFVVSRAVAELPLLLEYCVPFVKPGGYFVSYKGRKYQEELQLADNAFRELTCHLEATEAFSLSEEEREKRVLLFIRNNEKTKDKYPRKAGKPKKNPL
ncbi:MAG: 16S rRNA (guanine(527)-N(7))-methyltransferase RsmG [Lachnospiraceae bacterium]|nr:16S rRNA (guanine(527)-N(7))-methyltransferase RsmG [Lachnospiraceae bacterium]